MLTKSSTLVILFSVVSIALRAQDTLTLKNGLTLYGLITEVNNTEIKFRVDGGSVTIDQVKSYHKAGQSIVVKGEAHVQNQTNPANKPQDCEIKNVGDVEFENKTNDECRIQIYAIGTVPENQYDKSNPLITEITVPGNGTATAYELTTGIHYFMYFITRMGKDGSGQVKVTKCGVFKYTIK